MKTIVNDTVIRSFTFFLVSVLFNPSLFGELIPDRVQSRRPVAIAILKDGQKIVTANARSGTISLIDLTMTESVREFSIGIQLSDLVELPGQRRLLVTDEQAHELIAIRLSTEGMAVEKRIPVSRFPVTVRINREGSRAYVASLWSRMITVIDLSNWLSNDGDPSRAVLQQIRLPFAPREQLVVDVLDQQRFVPALNKLSPTIVVADAFGSKLATIDAEAGRVLSVREIPGHAIRALKQHPSKPQIVMTHQLLFHSGSTTFDEIHWGSLMANCLRSISVSDLLDPQADILKHSILEYLGGPDSGAADPFGFVIRPNGTMGIVISGTDEFMIDDGSFRFSNRLKTGSVPTAVVLSNDGTRAFVVNSFSDSVAVVNFINSTVEKTISLGSYPELSTADRGEQLFRSASLSHDNWISCASCHVDGHSNGLMNDNFTDGTFGTAKRVLSLRGVAGTAPYAWNGHIRTLAEQIEQSVQSTMQGKLPGPDQISDLETYLKTIPQAPALGSDDKQASERGARLFESLNCRICHLPPTYTSPQSVDVNLKDEKGNSKFNPPSLSGVSQNGPYFHDGRAQTLEAVFKDIRHQLDRNLSNDELRDLVAFLNDL